MSDEYTTERVSGPAEEGGAGAYCDLIKDPQGRVREIVEYDEYGNVTLRVYGRPPEDASQHPVQ